MHLINQENENLKSQLQIEISSKNQKDEFFKQKILEMETQVKLFIENDHK